MDSFRTLLGQLPQNGTLLVKCLHTPQNNEVNHFPARVVTGTLTFRVNPNEYQQFIDWIRNDDLHRISPMQFKWSMNRTKIVVDLDEEKIKVKNVTERILRDCFEYSQREHFQIETFRDTGDLENWRAPS